MISVNIMKMTPSDICKYHKNNILYVISVNIFEIMTQFTYILCALINNNDVANCSMIFYWNNDKILESWPTFCFWSFSVS